MHWLLSGLLGSIGTVVTLVLGVIGALFDEVLKMMLLYVVEPVLRYTIFNPFTFVAHGHLTTIGTVVQQVWATAAVASAGVALFMVLMGVFSRLAMTGWGSQQSWAEMGEGLAVWMMVLVAGWFFLNLLLGISNDGTHALMGSIQHITKVVFTPGLSGSTRGMTAVAGIGSLGTAFFTSLFWPISGLLILGLLIWAVGIWLMRQVDLVLYAGILPFTAALGINGNKAPFKWAWSEAMGAVFNQLAMAFIFWVGFLFLSAKPPAGMPTIIAAFYHMLLAVTTFTLAARAPQLLGNLTGHQSAGAGHLLTGMALGYIGGKGLSTAAGLTPAGQALKMAAAGRESHAKAQATSWAGRPTLTDRIKNSSLGQRVGAAAAAAGDSIRGSSVGQAVSRAAENHPTAARVASGVASIAGRGAAAVGRPLARGANMAFSPMASLGAMAATGIADSSVEGPAGTFAQSQAATVFMAEHGVEAAAAKYFGGESGMATMEGMQQLGNLVNGSISQVYQNDKTGETKSVPIGSAVPQGYSAMQDPKTGGSQYQVNFHSGSWQGPLYQKTQTSVLKNIPVTTMGSATYSMGSKKGKPDSAQALA